MSFSDKVVLLTGAGSGIGKGIAIHFAKLSAKLSLIDINSNSLNEVAQQCENISEIKVLKLVTDLAVRENVKKVVDATIQHYGKINVVINCAGIGAKVGITNPDLMKVIDKIITVNLKSVIALTHYAADNLIESKGNVINIASMFASTVIRDSIPYSAAKAGLVHFTKCAALELAGKGVRVNSISPGPVRTNIALNAFATRDENDKFWDTWADQSPLKNLVTAEDIAEIAEFLASDKAKNITGADYLVDGGWSLQKC